MRWLCGGGGGGGGSVTCGGAGGGGGVGDGGRGSGGGGGPSSGPISLVRPCKKTCIISFTQGCVFCVGFVEQNRLSMNLGSLANQEALNVEA